MNTNVVTLCVVAALLGAYVYRDRTQARPVTYRASGPEPDTILSDLPTDAPNLYLLTKPPWMVVPIRPFRADNKEFPKRHRYRDPQGPMADVYNPNMN